MSTFYNTFLYSIYSGSDHQAIDPEGCGWRIFIKKTLVSSGQTVRPRQLCGRTWSEKVSLAGAAQRYYRTMRWRRRWWWC